MWGAKEKVNKKFMYYRIINKKIDNWHFFFIFLNTVTVLVIVLLLLVVNEARPRCVVTLLILSQLWQVKAFLLETDTCIRLCVLIEHLNRISGPISIDSARSLWMKEIDIRFFWNASNFHSTLCLPLSVAYTSLNSHLCTKILSFCSCTRDCMAEMPTACPSPLPVASIQIALYAQLQLHTQWALHFPGKNARLILQRGYNSHRRSLAIF